MKPYTALETRLIQRGLVGHGYKIKIDGMWGPKTQRAFDSFALYAAKHRVFKTPTQSIPATVVKIALSQVGVKEICNNEGVQIREYQSATWLPPSPWPWCAAFVCWVVKQAMTQVVFPKGFTRPRTAGAWDFEKWAQGGYGAVPGVTLYKPRRNRKIKAGDVLVHIRSHIGIAVADQKGKAVLTVEGNTNGRGSREGDGVYKKVRSASEIRSIIRFA